MKAVILAAGRGSRLGPLGETTPKCMLSVGGVTILENAVARLHEVGVTDIVAVVGHLAERVTVPGVTYIVAPAYETTNNSVSLWLARDHLDQDTFLIEGDVFLGPSLLPSLSGTCAALADIPGPGSRATVTDRVVEIHPGRGDLKTVNVYRLGRDFLKALLPFLEVYARHHPNEYYEAAIADALRRGHQMGYTVTDDWYEVDTAEDLRLATAKFSRPDYDRVAALHGRFWAHGVVDHCHLYNMYFPPDALLNALDVRRLVTAYPSGQRELCEVLSSWIGVEPDRLAVGNGASEIIRCLGGGLKVSTPSFNEFEIGAETVPLGESWAFSPGRFLDGLDRPGVIVTPNNPTSVAVPRAAIVEVLESTRQLVIVDESFIDFSGEASCLGLLDHYPNLAVLKSLGKSLGACGLRLGFLASRHPVVGQVRGRLPIWNVNGFAEEFLRQIPRFGKEFRASCARTMADRDALYAGLAAIPGVVPVRPDANFLFCKVPRPGVARDLFSRGILVKDCSGKTMPGGEMYLRIGCRTPTENAALCRHLAEVLANSIAACSGIALPPQ